MEICVFIKSCLEKESFQLFTDFFNIEWPQQVKDQFESYSFISFSSIDETIFKRFSSRKSKSKNNILVNPPMDYNSTCSVVYTVPFFKIDCISLKFPNVQIIKLLQESALTNTVAFFIEPLKNLYVFEEGDTALNFDLNVETRKNILFENWKMSDIDMFKLVYCMLSENDVKISDNLYKKIKHKLEQVRQLRNFEIIKC